MNGILAVVEAHDAAARNAYNRLIRCAEGELNRHSRAEAVGQCANRGQAYSRKGAYAQALVDMDEVIRRNPQNPSAYESRAMVQVQAGDLAKAVEDFSRAIQLNPRDAVAYWNRGKAYRTLGDAQKADADTATALQIDPTLSGGPAR